VPEVIIALCAGVLTGFILRRKTRLLHGAEKAANAAVYALLLLLGVSIGGNGDVLRNLPRLGARAALISLAGVAGSAALSALASRYLFRKEKGHED
jgi:uncharacterized membrane protein YbjE (DUF340 family)